jgi:hypothetical protein
VRRVWQVCRTLAAALVDPAGACRNADQRPAPLGTAAVLLVAVTVLGALTLPRQLHLLGAALAPAGNASRDLHHQALASGLSRLMWFDRLVPPPTAVLAGLLLAWAADPLLGLARDARPRLASVVVLGLAPLLAQRAGELAMAYLADLPTPLTPGSAIDLPQEFVTGPAVFWRQDAPRWLQALSPRANLITVWSVGIWATGLRELDGGAWRTWHVTLPIVCLAGAGLTTWWFERAVVALILGGP